LAGNSDLAAWVHAVAHSRDREAFARLFDHFAPRLEAWLIRAGADSGTAEEVTQDVMVTLWRKAELFDASKSSVTTWLYRIARNRRTALPEEQLALVRLAFFDGLSHSDIATKTGLPLGTVKSRIRLAFTRLRRNLEAVGVVEVS
jgi:RNA polymerase sigma-70 factor (ECF subfamily)